MVNQLIAQLLSHLMLQTFNLIIGKFNDFARLNINQMIVMVIGRGFITGAAIA